VCVCVCVCVCVWCVCFGGGECGEFLWLAAMTSGTLQMLCAKGMRGARTCRIARELVDLGGCCARAQRAVLTPRGTVSAALRCEPRPVLFVYTSAGGL